MRFDGGVGVGVGVVGDVGDVGGFCLRRRIPNFNRSIWNYMRLFNLGVFSDCIKRY